MKVEAKTKAVRLEQDTLLHWICICSPAIAFCGARFETTMFVDESDLDLDTCAVCDDLDKVWDKCPRCRRPRYVFDAD